MSKWRVTGDFAAGKSETLQSLNQGTSTGPTVLKVHTVVRAFRKEGPVNVPWLCIMQEHDANTKTKYHLLVNTF